MNKNEILLEFAQCLRSEAYAIRNYLKVYDQTQDGFVPFKLFEKQEEIINAYKKHRHNIIAKPRQAGISTTTQGFLAIKAALASRTKPEIILIIANKLTLAKKFTKGIKDFINQLPRWMFGAEFFGTKEREKKDIFETNSQTEMTLAHNGTKIIAVATSGDALRGYSPTYLVFDEAAFIDNGEEVFSAAMSSLSTGGKAILISTPNGHDPVYYETYKGSVQQENTNGFNAIDMRWYQDPRYNKDLEWGDKDGNMIPEDDFTFESYESKIRQGLKPTSTWYRTMSQSLGNNKKKIAQELDVSFIGSGGNVIEDEYIQMQEELNVRNPEWEDNTFWDGNTNRVYIWEKPILDHKYILSADVSSGAGNDFSTFSVIDATTMEQVVEFQGKIQPDKFAKVIYKYGVEYNAYVVVDNINVGASTVLKLVEMNYPNLHYDDYTPKALSNKKLDISKGNKIPGFNVTGVRLQMISHLEEMVRENVIKIRSKRIINEMRTFVYKNNRPDHQDGKNDDCLMALAIGLWILESSFKKLEKVNVQSKAILSAWASTSSPIDPRIVKKSMENMKQKEEAGIQTNFNPFCAHTSTSHIQKRIGGEYDWLFGR